MNSVSREVSSRPAVIFDLGGVLVDWNPRYLYTRFFPGDPQALERFFEEVDWFTWNVKQDAGRPFSVGVPELAARFPERAELIKAYDQYYAESIGGLFEENVQLLKELHAAGYPVYALSNWPYEKFLELRPQLEFVDLFDGMVISGQVRLLKPDPRIFKLMLDTIGRPAGECIFIDDVQVNIDAACALGFRCILYTDPSRLREDLAAAGVQL